MSIFQVFSDLCSWHLTTVLHRARPAIEKRGSLRNQEKNRLIKGEKKTIEEQDYQRGTNGKECWLL